MKLSRQSSSSSWSGRRTGMKQLAAAAQLQQELTKERDEALATAEQLTTEREEALARAEQLQLEQSKTRDHALAAALQLQEQLTSDRDQARATATHFQEELTKQRDEALAATAQLQEELSKEREQRGSLSAESDRAARRSHELEGAVATEQARSHELEQSLVRADAHVSELEAELKGVRAELREDRLPETALDAAASVPESNGPEWNMASQRALSAALVGQTEWRLVLKHAVGTLGSQGGWDATIAWRTEKPRGLMKCGAIWTCESAGLATFETRTWQHVEDAGAQSSVVLATEWRRPVCSICSRPRTHC